MAEKIRLALASGEPCADVIQLNYTQVPEFAEAGALEDLSDIYEGTDPEPKQIPESNIFFRVSSALRSPGSVSQIYSPFSSLKRASYTHIII